jgi:stage II sporulation protein D
MRRIATLIILLLALALGGEARAASPVFVFNGFGFGHGIGMGQYGAYGFAQHGRTYGEILAHYYQGTELGPAPVRRVRVLLASGRAAIEIASDSPFFVQDGNGRRKLPAGSHRLGGGLALDVNGRTRTLAAPVRFLPGTSPLRFEREYRGSIVVTPSDGALLVVNDVGLESYVKGIVAGEMPANWHAEALKAQSVAARTFALASKKSSGPFDVYDDSRSQVYGGIDAEDPRTSAAVDATKGRVVLYQGNVAWTFFSSSSGGKTAAIQDVFPDSEPRPYLVSVDDPHDDISPYHRWGPIKFTAEQLSARLGSRAPAELTDLKVELNGSGRVEAVTAVGAGGQTVKFSGREVRTLLGLRSTGFRVDVMGAPNASPRRIVYGRKASLRGRVKGVRKVEIEQRRAGGRWTSLRTVAVRRNGRLKLAVAPKVTTLYRLALRSARSAAVRVFVAPDVSLEGGASRRLSGKVRPKLSGRDVTIQRRNAAAWEAVASARITVGGRFATARKLAPGVYRARVSATPRLVAGMSNKLKIPAE